MAAQIYNRLREQMDQYSTGFPATASGIELKILQKLFTEDEARLYLDMSMLLEAPDSVAQRTGRDADTTADMLEDMARKGTLFRFRRGDKASYAAVPFVIGSYEFQLGRMDREFAEMVEAYFNEGMLPALAKNIVPLRTLPVNQSLDIAHQVSSFPDAKTIIRGKDKIAVADCICRQHQGLLDKGCGKPNEVCILFGAHADYYVENGMARFINQDEAVAILDTCEEAGLVNQPANMVNPGGMCNCCGDCCGVLRGLKQMPKPAEMVYNNYWAVVEADECTACEMCLDRCQMEAITMGEDELAVVDSDRCIGCGLCVTTCPTEAIQLVLKPEELWKAPPKDGKELIALTAEKRGTSLMPLSMMPDEGAVE
jgi:electron transport complex protein RnfB